MEVAFRPAGQGDLDALIAFRRELCARDPVAFDERRARAAISDLIREPAWGRIWLLLDGETPIGYVALCIGYSLEFYGREAIVDELFIRSSHRGQGIGRRALAHVETEARALGVHALHLVVETWNTPALELYRRVGYQAHDRYLMTKWLVSSRNPG